MAGFLNGNHVLDCNKRIEYPINKSHRSIFGVEYIYL